MTPHSSELCPAMSQPRDQFDQTGQLHHDQSDRRQPSGYATWRPLHARHYAPCRRHDIRSGL